MRIVAPLTTAVFVGLMVAVATGGLVPRVRPRGVRRDPAASVWLAQAGVAVSPRQFAAVSGALGMAVLVLVGVTTTVPAVAVVPAVGAALAPHAYFARERARRLRRLQESWPDGLRDLLASVSAGLSLHQAMLGLADNGPVPLREALSRYPTLARVLGVVPALRTIQEELADPTTDRVIEVLALAYERGGQMLPGVLTELAEATTRDLQLSEQIATESLEQRINARAVFVLPWLVLLMLTLQDGMFREFYRSRSGVAVVLVGAAMSLAGLAVVARLSRDPVEPRVFGSGAQGRASQ